MPEVTLAAADPHELEPRLEERGGGLADHDALGFGEVRQCRERRERPLLVPEVDPKGAMDLAHHRLPGVHRDLDRGSRRVAAPGPLCCLLDRHRGQRRASRRVLDRVQTERRHDRRRTHFLDLPPKTLDLFGADRQGPTDEE